tara:strand:- start:383 stop:811 length:429 start_codon:yes stop_codon:yes gene_type:complete
MATSPDQTVYFNGYHNRSPGLGSVGAYQVAGTPYLTASHVDAGQEVQITFPALPRSITIINKDAANDDLHIRFASVGLDASGDHYISLDAQNSSVTFNVRTRSIFLQAPVGAVDFQLFAELTGIATNLMPDFNIANWPGITV